MALNDPMFIFIKALLYVIIYVLFVIPLVAILVILFTLFRALIAIRLMMKYGWQFRLMKGQDAAYGIADPQKLSTFSGFFIFNGCLDVEKFRTRVQEQWTDVQNHDGSWKFEKLRSRIVNEFGYYFFLPDRNFQLENHVKLYNGSPIRNKHELSNLLSHLQNAPLLLPDAPPWLFLIVPLADNYNGVAGKKTVIYGKFSHVLTDAMALLRLIGTSLVDEPIDHILNTQVKSYSQLALLRRLYSLTKCFLMGPKYAYSEYAYSDSISIVHPTKLNGKTFTAFSELIALDKVKRIKNMTNVTVNDIMLTSITSALRSYIIAKNANVPELCRAVVPISFVDMTKSPTLENVLIPCLYHLPIGESNSLKRLKTTNEQMSLLKKDPNIWFLDFFGKLLMNRIPSTIFTQGMNNGIGITAVISNAPAFQQKVNICRAQLEICGGFIPSYQGVGITFFISSCNGNLIVCINADSAVIGSQEELDVIAWHVKDELEELESQAFLDNKKQEMPKNEAK